jgi:hypothetical protein
VPERAGRSAASPARLRLLPAAAEVAAESGRPGPGARQRLLDELGRAAAGRRRRGRVLAVAAALVLVAGVGLGAPRLLRPARPPAAPAVAAPAVAAPAMMAMTATGSAPGWQAATGAVAAVDKSWGSALSVTVTGGRPGERLKLVVIDSKGRAEIVGWWVTGGKTVRCEGSTSIRRSAVAEIQVRTADDNPVLAAPVL